MTQYPPHDIAAPLIDGLLPDVYSGAMPSPAPSPDDSPGPWYWVDTGGGGYRVACPSAGVFVMEPQYAHTDHGRAVIDRLRAAWARRYL